MDTKKEEIKELPKNLNYHPIVELKLTGKPKMVLDVSRSSVHMVPEHLKGVDQLVARKGQIQYIAPDFSGEIMCLELPEKQGLDGKYMRSVLPEGEKQFLMRSYIAQKKLNPSIFDKSFTDVGSPDLEKNLPPNLVFSWDFESDAGKLDARETGLMVRPVITNVETVLMPTDKRLRMLAKLNNIEK